jgi:glutamine cyclotransferase
MKLTILNLKTNLVAALILSLAACESGPKVSEEKSADTAPVKTTPLIPFTIVNRLPHDTTAFTEGLLFYNNNLLESTGAQDYMAYARSTFGIADVQKGKLDVKVELDKKTYFGEGIVVFDDKIYQVTYKNQTGFIYNAKTFQRIGQFSYPNKEGWGLTTDGTHLIMSDGTFNLTYLDPKDQRVVKVLAVTENGFGLDNLNELEYINGFIYANVYLTNTIVKIDPASGQVVQKMEMDELVVEVREKHRSSMEMNGIAYDSINDKVLVTGKFWPYIYEIKFAH